MSKIKPVVDVTVPNEPDWETIYDDGMDVNFAHDQWEILCQQMAENKTLTRSRGHAIKRLVQFRVEYERVSREVAGHGSVTKTRGNKVPKYNIYYSVMTKVDESITSLEKHLGLTPSAAPKEVVVKEEAVKEQKPARPADRYLRSVG